LILFPAALDVVTVTIINNLPADGNRNPVDDTNGNYSAKLHSDTEMHVRSLFCCKAEIIAALVLRIDGSGDLRFYREPVRFIKLMALSTNGRLALSVMIFGAQAAILQAQDNYEIQVYGADTVPAGATMVELHNNVTVKGRTQTADGVLPTDHAFHETLEITRGFTSWFETGFYVFSSARSGEGWQWVGDHIRPRVRVPESWHWPVGLSLSGEIGYQQRRFSQDTWTAEIRPIIDKQVGPWYAAFNPALEKSLSGANSARGFGFSPSAKLSCDLTKVITLGLEYYASLGDVMHFDQTTDQQHMLVPAIDLNISPKWELNVGVGIGMTHSTDHLLVKMIIGRRF